MRYIPDARTMRKIAYVNRMKTMYSSQEEYEKMKDAYLFSVFEDTRIADLILEHIGESIISASKDGKTHIEISDTFGWRKDGYEGTLPPSCKNIADIVHERLKEIGYNFYCENYPIDDTRQFSKLAQRYVCVWE